MSTLFCRIRFDKEYLSIQIKEDIIMPVCYIHPDSESVGVCVRCGNFICSACDVILDGKHYCKRCVGEIIGRSPLEKKLTRSRSDKMLAGICAGFAKYANIDPTLVRVLFVILCLLTGGIALIAYIILIFVIPKEVD